MDYKNNILELIGNTPLVKLNKLNRGLKPQIFAKLESANPGGSNKDRIGLNMILDAEKKGILKPGGTIVEATSGNTGIGLALTAAVKGYKAIMVLTDKASSEKVKYLKGLGAEVIVVSNAAEHDSPEFYVTVAKRIAEETPNSVFIYQYGNPANAEAHYKTTGPEIWKQTDGNITHFIAGVGTGGTISGTGRFLKEMNPNIQVIGADPVGSIFKTYKEENRLIKGTPYLVEGIGQDCLPANVHFQYIDKFINVSDADSFSAARKLSTIEGIFAGGSTGTAVHVTLEVAKDLSENDIIVFVVCDTGERYLTKVFDIEWLKEHGMYAAGAGCLKDISNLKKASGVVDLVYAEADNLVKDVLEKLHRYGFNQMPVLKDGRAVGCVIEARLTSVLLENTELLNAPINDVLSHECFPIMDADSSLKDVRKELKDHQAVLVKEYGRITDIITRYDLIEFLSKNN
ncbi:MAG: pyridoxal-phosphate dependent enzyme [Bacteroidetes bacterium]|nr:pyridoxal-phosphate dependent enzyme [Bacteroidota bacterium]